MRLGVSFRTWAVVRLLIARTASASPDCAVPGARRHEQFLLKLRHNLFHRRRYRSSSTQVSRVLLLRCVSPHNFQQSPSSKLPRPPTRSQPTLPASYTTQQRIQQRSSELCTPRAQTITTSANQRHATIIFFDCVSCAVDLVS